MEQTNAGGGAPQRPMFLQTLCILSFIGSGLWALISLIGIFAGGWIMSFIGGGAMNDAMQSGMAEGMEGLEGGAEAAAAMADAGSGMMGMLSSYLIIIFVVSLVLAALSLFGVMKMWKQKKMGFWIYAIVNGILAVFGLIGGGLVGAIIGIAFIVMYGLNLKHMS